MLLSLTIHLLGKGFTQVFIKAFECQWIESVIEKKFSAIKRCSQENDHEKKENKITITSWLTREVGSDWCLSHLTDNISRNDYRVAI